MSKRVQADVEPFYFHYPAGATVVTSHAGGRDNAMAVAWHTAISHEPPYYLISISEKRFTHELVVESGEFVVNFMPIESAELVARVAGCSGKEVDKFRAFEIEAEPGSKVRAPVLADAMAAYECRVVERHVYGDHALFLGEILAVQWEPSAFGSDGMLDLETAHPIVYMGDDRYSTASWTTHVDREALVRAALEAAR